MLVRITEPHEVGRDHTIVCYFTGTGQDDYGYESYLVTGETITADGPGICVTCPRTGRPDVLVPATDECYRHVVDPGEAA